MDSSGEAAVDERQFRLARKLRKKLRQIENLEQVERELNEEEWQKVSKKQSIRQELSVVVADMKRRSDERERQQHAFSDANDAQKSVSDADDAENCVSDANAAVARQAKRKKVQPKPEVSASNALGQENQLEISLFDPSSSSGEISPPEVASQQTQSEPGVDNVQVPSPASDAGSGGGGVQISLSTLAPSSPGQQQQQQQQQQKTKKKRAQKQQQQPPEDPLRRREVLVRELTGHEDLALAVAVASDGKMAATASRDTTVLVWDLENGRVKASLRGHTMAVTALVWLPKRVNELLKLPSGTSLLASGSLDCSLKLWDACSGRQLRSVYTYNGIKRLCYCPQLDMLVTGTDGGKVEMFPLDGDDGQEFGREGTTARPRHSFKAHDDAIMAMDVGEKLLCTGSRDGVLKVWEASRERVKTLFVSEAENVRTADDDQAAHQRCILDLKLIHNDHRIAYGDAGSNLKLLDWRLGLLHKLPNHATEVGFTDSLLVVRQDQGQGDLLLASGYDLDTGLGQVNAFRLPKADDALPEYVCTWTDDETSRIFGLSACQPSPSSGDLSLVTCGREVKHWRTADRSADLPDDDDAVLARPYALPVLARRAAVDSGSEDDDDSDLEHDSSVRTGSRCSSRNSRRGESSQSRWWCTIA